jgi:hypothetical protein
MKIQQSALMVSACICTASCLVESSDDSEQSAFDQWTNPTLGDVQQASSVFPGLTYWPRVGAFFEINVCFIEGVPSPNPGDYAAARIKAMNVLSGTWGSPRGLVGSQRSPAGPHVARA